MCCLEGLQVLGKTKNGLRFEKVSLQARVIAHFYVE
jgi:hypothetical protein